jgi:hypothetical protein
MDLKFNDDDDLNTAMVTETLAANDLIAEEFAEGSDRSQLPKQRIGGREFLVVEQSASLRANFNMSLIWQCGTEILSRTFPLHCNQDGEARSRCAC